MHMPEFPFVHVVFQQNDPEKLVDFLVKLGKTLGSSYDDGCVPNVIIQGRRGVLVAPFKDMMEMGGIGSGDVAGHKVFESEKEFRDTTYDQYMQRLSSQLFTKDELSVAQLL